MSYQFRKHYTREEARELLPELRVWFKQIAHNREMITECEKVISPLLESGADCGGVQVELQAKAFARLKELIGEFARREIQIKDLDRGLVDFPALMGGREIFLCWELDEPDIEFWHDLTSGYAGREPL
jgi:hypothetical protein